MTSTETNSFPIISIVFVSWNRQALLEAAIESLYKQEYPHLELIVVDNGSTDGSVEWLRSRQDIQLIEHTKNIGASAARNEGTRIAAGDFVIYMDSDAELRTPGALQSFVKRMRSNPDIGGMSGVIYNDEALEEIWCWSPCMDWEGNHDMEASKRPIEEPAVLSTCFVLFRLPLVRQAGGFDEYYFYLYEDGDLCERIRKLGYRLEVDPKIKILHRYSEKGRKRFEQIEYHYYHEKLRMYYVLKNWGLKRFLQSFWYKWKHFKRLLACFPYLPLWRYIDIYLVRAVWLLVRFPWIRLNRRKKWI